MNYMQNYSMSQMSQPNYSMMNQSNYMTNIPQTSQPNYYPTPSDQYPPYEQSQSQQHQPIYPYNPYPSSNSINFSNSNDFAFENSDKSFLFAKSKAVNNISPYREMKNRNESHPADIKNFMRSPWGLKSMLYDVEEDYSLKDIPENISGNYFRDKKMYKNTDENLRSRVMLNQKKKETTAKITIEDEDFDVCFQQRPRRYLESLEKERFHKKTRSVSPANVIEMNNQIIDHNSRNSFLNCTIIFLFQNYNFFLFRSFIYEFKLNSGEFES